MTHTGAVESITGTRVTITRNRLKEGVRDVGCCGPNAAQDNLHIFLVRGSCRAQSEMAGAAPFKPVATSLLALVSTVYVKEVTLISSTRVLASKAGDNTSVTWPRDVTFSVAREEITKFPNATCGTSMMLRLALTEALKDAAQHVSRVGTLEEDLHVCFFRHRMLVAHHAKTGRKTRSSRLLQALLQQQRHRRTQVGCR